MAGCSITGLPIAFCAHCQNGLPTQFDIDNRGFRPQEGRKLAIAFPSMDVTIRRAVGDRSGGDGYIIRPGKSGRQAYRATGGGAIPLARSSWRNTVQMKTFNALIGMKEGGLYDRHSDESDDARRSDDDE